MGCDRHFCCQTCKTDIYLGYGSYSSWLDCGVRTAAQYDALPDTYKPPLSKNKNFRAALEKHEGHDWFCWSSDYCSVNDKTGDLELDAGYSVQVWCKDFRGYTKENLDVEV